MPASSTPDDEFSLLDECSAEIGVALPHVQVHRVFVPVAPDRQLSAIAWGPQPAPVALLHGGAQNAHTWDMFAIAWRRSLIAIDLPGHGHSDRPAAPGGQLDVRSNAADVATALAGLAPEGAVVIGMSLGGLTAIALAAIAPRMVRALVLVDTVPGAKVARARHIVEAVEEWTTFNDFDAELARLLRAQPSRSASSVRRGMLNNAVRRDDGTWLWRWARHGAPDTSGLRHPSAASIHPELWEDLERIEVPVMLVRGMLPGSVLDEDNETDLRRRAPGARVVRVPSAGHSVHSDAPLDLAAQVGEFLTDNDLIER